MGMRIGRTLVVFVALTAALAACGGAADAPGPVAGSGSPPPGPAASPVATEGSNGSTVTVPLMHELELTGPALETDTGAMLFVGRVMDPPA